jgi:hypothetical protein
MIMTKNSPEIADGWTRNGGAATIGAMNTMRTLLGSRFWYRWYDPAA